MQQEIRNIAIIAHVDHGKTTLTDALMKQCGVGVEGQTMDSNPMEKERGITITAKNTSVPYKGVKINIGSERVSLSPSSEGLSLCSVFAVSC